MAFVREERAARGRAARRADCNIEKWKDTAVVCHARRTGHTGHTSLLWSPLVYDIVDGLVAFIDCGRRYIFTRSSVDMRPRPPKRSETVLSLMTMDSTINLVERDTSPESPSDWPEYYWTNDSQSQTRLIKKQKKTALGRIFYGWRTVLFGSCMSLLHSIFRPHI